MSDPNAAAARLRRDGQPIGDVYLGRAEIASRVAELGSEIAAEYGGRLPLLVAPLKSSAVFLADRVPQGAECLYGLAHEAICRRYRCASSSMSRR